MSNNKIKSLGDRMKNYESVYDYRLLRRSPVIVRVDGKAFHTFTKGLKKPFDNIFNAAMTHTCIKLVDNIAGCKLAYSQSDEISLLLVDYNKYETQSFFDYRVQKVCSVVASMTTCYFNKYLEDYFEDIQYKDEEEFKYVKLWLNKKGIATFDARAFNLSKEEVNNYFLWRQQDATINSIQALGRSKFSHKQLLNKSLNEIQDMLMSEYGINWNNMETKYKRGFCVLRVPDTKDDDKYIHSSIILDEEIPLFNKYTNYINRLVYVNEEVSENVNKTSN